MISLIFTAADRDFLRPWGGAATVCKTDQEHGYLCVSDQEQGDILGTLSLEGQEGRSQDGTTGLTGMEQSPSALKSLSRSHPWGPWVRPYGSAGPWDGH